VAVLLASYGADVEAADKEGNTPIEFAQPPLREKMTVASAANMNET